MKKNEGEFLLQLDEEKDDLFDKIIKTNINDRRIVINNEINDSVIEDIVLYIFLWNKEDKGKPVESRKKIFIYVSTDGGDVVSGNMILTAVENSKTPIVTVGLAKASSMGSYILASGHERICFDNTVLLLHDGQVGYCTSGQKSKDLNKFYDDLDEYNMNFMIKHTTMTKEYLESIKDREMYVIGEKIKELGVVDKIIGIDCDLDYIL